MAKKNKKTNVMRLLDQANISYTAYDFEKTGETRGEKVAALINANPEQVFKTLVTVAASGQNYVFDIPVCKELDLKKAALAVGEKSIHMIPAKDLLALTGYVHGGCSPIGMKKDFPKVFDMTAQNFDSVIISAGKIGHQVQVQLKDLNQFIKINYADLIK